MKQHVKYDPNDLAGLTLEYVLFVALGKDTGIPDLLLAESVLRMFDTAL